MLVPLVDMGGALSWRGCDCIEVREVRDAVAVCLNRSQCTMVYPAVFRLSVIRRQNE